MVESTGATPDAATITITGTAGTNVSGVGVRMTRNALTFVPPDNRVTSVAGAVFINGDGSTAAEGVAILEDSDVEVVSGPLNVVGTGGTGAGVRLEGGLSPTSFLATGAADMNVTSLAGPISLGAGSLVGGATATGNITLVSDEMEINGSTIQASGSLTILPNTPTTSIGLGGGNGGLNLIDAELQALVDGFSSITIGDIAAGTGTVDIETVTLTDPVTIAGGTINDNANTDITAPSVTLDGNVSPGQSPGILTVIGNFAFADNDIFTVEVGGTTTRNREHESRPDRCHRQCDDRYQRDADDNRIQRIHASRKRFIS